MDYLNNNIENIIKERNEKKEKETINKLQNKESIILKQNITKENNIKSLKAKDIKEIKDTIKDNIKDNIKINKISKDTKEIKEIKDIQIFLVKKRNRPNENEDIESIFLEPIKKLKKEGNLISKLEKLNLNNNDTNNTSFIKQVNEGINARSTTNTTSTTSQSNENSLKLELTTTPNDKQKLKSLPLNLFRFEETKIKDDDLEARKKCLKFNKFNKIITNKEEITTQIINNKINKLRETNQDRFLERRINNQNSHNNINKKKCNNNKSDEDIEEYKRIFSSYFSGKVKSKFINLNNDKLMIINEGSLKNR